MPIETAVNVNASAHSRRGSNFPPVDPAASRNKSCVATTSQKFSLDAAPRIKNQFVATLTARQQLTAMSVVRTGVCRSSRRVSAKALRNASRQYQRLAAFAPDFCAR